ncbi:Twitchin [Nymphon striatum]|nr:Twitchin [Nymphon striatum]
MASEILSATPTKTTVDGLKENVQYQFRVKAVNKAGPGEPSEPSKVIIAKARFVKPYILDELGSVIVKKGATITFDIRIGGEPPPDIKWELNNKDVNPSDRIKIDNNAKTTKVVIKNATRIDSGKYTLTLSNSSGTASNSGEAIVLDKPSMPLGPLRLDEVRANHCKVSWNKPKDDGGTEIKGYTLEKMDTDTGRWVPCGEVGPGKTNATIEGLTPNKNYKIRVKAVNKEGESEPLELEKPFLAKNPYDEPGHPGKPEIVDWDNTRCDLKWPAPENDGGRPILYYVIEKKDKFSNDFKEVLKTDGPKCEARVPDLKENQEVQFRVRAVNKSGPSKPSEPTKPHIVKHRYLKPTIDRTNLKAIMIKVGKAYKFEVDVRGEPPPDVTWVLKEVKVSSNEDVVVTNKNYYTELHIKKALRKYSGKYTITATNTSGKDVAEVDVTVLGKPSKPEGPLEVSDVRKEGCQLKWKKPKDDGGTPIKEYLVEKMDKDTGKWTRVGKTDKPEMEVTGLTPGKEYQFRATAVNAEGDSEPLETKDFTLARNPYDPPGPPGTPELIDWDNTSVEIEWTHPEDDGRNPIKKYIVEKKDKFSSQWEKAVEVSGKETTAKVPNLIEKAEMQFRVIAVNDAGPGEPSNATKLHVMKHRRLKPYIERNNLENVMVKSGKPIKLDVNVRGEPAPEITWEFKKDVLVTKDNVTINNIDYNTKLSINDSKRANSGVYKIIAVNQHGKDEAEVEIIVLSVPSKPKGPLKVENVTAKGCKLKWEKPEDDGGSPLQRYDIEKMDTSSGRWVPVGKADKDATDFDVTGLQPGKNYQFRVKAVNAEGSSEPLETSKATLAKNPYDEAGKPGTPVIDDWDANKVDLKWDVPKSDGGAPITGYIVEKKDKFGSGWEPVVETTSSKPEATVEGLTKGQQYQFRVKAINKAGPGEPSDATKPHIAKERYLKPKINREKMNTVSVRAGQFVKFDVDIIGEPPPTCKWSFAGKDLEPSDSIKIENPEYMTHLQILRTTRKESGVYKLTATNTSGEDVADVTVNILDKPSKPEGPLEVSDVHKEGCKLNWNKPKDDGGMPLDGYTIEKLDPTSGRWVPCGRTDKDTTDFVVKGLDAGKKYQFRVKAINDEGESEPLETDRPILAKNPFDEPGAPGTPEIADYDHDFVKLKWDSPIKDGGAPITGYIIEKKDKYSKDWIKAVTVPGNVCEGKVPDLQEGEKYEFRVRAVNKAGPGEPSDETSPFIAKHKHLKPKIDRTNLKNVTVKVGHPVDFDIKVIGEPPPTIVWKHKDTEISTGDVYRLDNVDYNTQFHLLRATRKETGVYKIIATNDSGSDEAEVEIMVLGRPGKPKGPLEVDNVHAEGCSLKWQKPEDDGGSPIEYYEVEKMDLDTGRWVPVGKASGDKMEVTNLTPGKDYKFRVRAVNKEGESEELETDLPILAKNPYDEPDKPGRPEPTDWDKDHVDLKWSPPKEDGGAPIEKYVIEKRKKGAHKWLKAKEVPADKPEGTVDNLEEGCEYEFRVKAINKAGEGKPSDPSRSIVAKPRFLAPKINRKNLNDVSIRVGQTLKFEADVIGEPPPKIVWHFKDQVLEPTDRIKIENEEYSTMFVYTKVKRKDTGAYKVTATNSSGTDEVIINVNVLSKPGKPKGPLEVADVHAEGCKLKWDKPEDDGGQPIENYLVEKMDTETGRWVPVGTTKTPEMDVEGLVPGKEYKFRVKAANAEGESEPLETDAPTVAKNPYDEPGKPGKPVATDWDKHHIDLKWVPPSSDGGDPVTSYIIEKKDKYSAKWQKAIEVEGDKCEARVPDLMNGMDYQFRVKAVNRAGPGKPSDASDTVTAKPRFLAPEIDRLCLKDVTIHAGQTIKYDVKVTGEPPPTCSWYHGEEKLVKSIDIVIENTPNRSKITIRNAQRKDTGMYKITAENTSGKDEADVNITVLDKPSPPGGPLEVSDVHKEGCKLKWNPPEDDGGEPVSHYAIEKLDKETGRWVPVGRTDKPEFEVQNLEPGHEYQFRVKAVNNEGESEPLTTDHGIVAKNPFDEPGEPGAPVAKDWDKDHVDLKWDPPVKDGGAPITGYIIEKKEKDSPTWTKAVELDGPVCEGCVPNLVEGESYEFRVKAVNAAGPGEPSQKSKVITAKPRKLAPKIDRRHLNNITLKKGEAFVLDAKIIGEPPPTTKWYLNKKEVEEIGEVTIEDKPYFAKLTNDNATRKDSGKYKLVASNQHGTDEAEIDVTVVDKPTKPEGPLEVSDVNKNGCKLKWKKPKDDGGTPLEAYVVEKQDPDTGIWLPVAKTHQPEVEITGLTPGKQYNFRVKAVNKEGESEPLETEIPVLAKDPYDAPGSPGKPEATDWNKDHVDLKWTPPAKDGGAPITGYLIEKKEKGSPRWEKAAEVPGDKCSGTAPYLDEGKEYEFRVSAINKAGVGEPSEVSLPVIAKPRFLAPKIDRKMFKDVTLRAGQALKFDVDVQGEPPPEIIWNVDGKSLESSNRSLIENENYNTKLTVRQMTRKDDSDYNIIATNTSGKDSVTVHVTVLDKPSAPGGPLEVSDVHKEGCKLKWKPPEDDGGMPVDGYEVEKQDESGVWVPVGKTRDPEMEVSGLTPGKDYKFRVKAINKEGESDPLETDGAITAKNPFDEPGKPGSVEATDWDKDHVDLKWTPPENNGGAPIEKYIIEKKDKYGDWEKAAEVPGDATTGTAGNLVAGQPYEFRVRAVNKAGPGEPSDSTGTIIAKPRKLAPKIDRTNLEKVKIKAGQAFSFDVNVIGEPPPTKIWTLKKKQVKSSDKIKITEEPYNIKISVRQATRADNGTYTLTAENEHGKDEATVEVVVMDKPGSPNGPLNISDVHADGCKLEWNPPSDDGGLPVDHYVAEKFDEATGRWMPAGETIGPETSIKIDGLQPGHKYKFRVRAVNRQGESDPLTADKSIIAKNPFDEPGKPGTPEIDDYDKDFVDLKWTPPESDGGSPITGFIIEKKDKYSPDWLPAAEVSGDETKARIPDLVEGNQYEFRVRAVNKGGPGEPSEATKPHTARHKNLAPRIDRNAMKDVRVKAGQPIDLEVPVQGEPPPTKKWTLDDNPVGLNAKIQNEDYKTIFSIKSAQRGDSGVLALTASNVNGTDSVKINVIVMDKPLAPEQLKVDDITKESCILNWKPPKDDGGCEITNYVVEKKDMESGRWVTIGEPYNNQLKVDKLMEMHEYKFRVKAVNRMGDSDWCTTFDSIIAKNPFDEPDKPGQPEVTDWDKDHVDLEWKAPRRDGGAPINEYIIEKKSKGSPIWEEVGKVPGDATKATVPNLKEGEEYEFRIVAVNKAGPSDPSDPSRSVIAKPRHLAPWIDKAALKDLRIRAGKPIQYKISLKGEPMPTVGWTTGNANVAEDSRVEIKTYPTETTFELRSSLRADTGKYTVTLSNDSGTISASAFVTVLDRPSPPGVPIDVADVTKESAVVSWRKPKDDGGCTILHYIVEKMDSSRGTWMECGTTPDMSLKVTKLIHKKEYHFRVMAVNEIGVSDPLETKDGTIAKNKFEEPDAPGKPKVTDWDKDHADIEWTPPKDIGGAPIEKYIIQKKERHSPIWSNAATVPADQTKGTVPDLNEGRDYEFRVIAVNKGGESEPSEASDFITAKPRFLAPKITSPMGELKVKAGEILNAEINFIGEPPPKVVWTVKGESLKSTDRSTVSAFDNYTVISTVNTQRSDSGEYILTLTNDSGKDEGTLKVIILDKPAAPEGPLEVSDVTQDSAKLSWNKPKDDGGSDLIGYSVEKRDKTHGGPWVPALSFVDPNATEVTVPRLIDGTEYEFRVKAENNQGTSAPLTADKSVKAKNPYDKPSKPGQPEAVDHDRDHIKIKWSPPKKDGGSPIIGYDIERRDLKTNRWVRLNKQPVQRPEYNDDTVTPDHQYEYRVSAKNAGGTSDPSDISKIIVAKPMKEKPKLHLDGIYGRTIKVKAGEPLIIDIPLSGAPTPTITWLKEGKPLPESNRILKKTGDENTNLTIPVSRRDDSGSYTIKAKNPYGEDSADLTVIVYDKPGPPRGPLTYPETTNTSITLAWKKPDDDGGAEITGYIIEKCEVGSDRWSPVQGYCPNTQFTVRNLDEGKKYKFRVMAETIHGISESLEGKPVVAKNPFDAPDAPGTPQVTDYSAKSVDLEWTPPTDDGGRPVLGYIIEKREKGSPDWYKVNNYPTPNTKFSVPNLKEGTTYEFRVMAVNDAGPGKPSRATQPVTAKDKQFVPKAPDVPRVDRITKDSVTISWNKPDDGGSKITGYTVQKKPKNAADWETVNPLPHRDTHFTIPKLTEGEEYQFRVIANNEIGDSPPSKPTDGVIAADQPDKPRIDASGLKDIVVKAGEQFKICVPFTGFPKPEAIWAVGEKDIDDKDPRIYQKVDPDEAFLVNKSAKRSDTGPYKVFLKNKSGFDTAYCNVTVLDRPSPPQNVKGEDVEGDSLTLVWQPPKDDGGGEITNYVVEKKEEGTKIWAKVSSFVVGTACRVRNLTIGKNYEFRVMAENQYGTSDPAMTEEPIRARHPFDPPGPPGVPRCVDSSVDSITLNWSKPRNDGGSPITGYIVEKRKVGEDKWICPATATIPDLTYRVPNLTENAEYEFRVCAVNAAGPGQWSSTSDIIVARPPPSAPKIAKDFGLRDIVVPAGEEFKITVPFSGGSPPPDATWTVNGDIIMPDERITCDVEASFVVFTNKCAKRGDSGSYTIKLTNPEGYDTASCKVLVVDVPSPPLPPFDAADITPDTCSLSWKPPEDDGGSPITNYIVEKCDVKTNVWQKISSFVRNTNYNVIGLESMHKYRFRVSAENQYGVSKPLMTESDIIAKFPFDPPDPPGQPKIVDWDTSSVNLTWERPFRDGGSRIQGYEVEYKDTMDDKWRKVNDFLLKDTSFNVRNLTEGHEYEFRVRAKNAAGFSKPSPPTASFVLKPKFAVPSPPRDPQVKKVGKSYVDLLWEKPKSDGGSKITGYIIERREVGSTFWFKSNDYNVTDQTFTALNLIEGCDYEFRIFAVNAAGKSRPSDCTSPVKVCEIPGGVKPEFVRKLFNKSANINASLTMECEAIGKPVPKAKWFKNGKQINPSARIQMEDQDGTYRLIFTKVLEDDDGEYMCQVENPLGSDKCFADIKVAEAPRIQRCPNEVFFPEGDNGKIKVHFTGTGPFEVQLFKDGLEFKEDDHLKFTVFDDYVIIFFKDVVKNDETQYKIKVSNESGTDEANTSVYVTGLPGPPEPPLEIPEITQNSATITWRPPKYDGGCKVTHYIVERKETTNDQWVTATSYCRTTSFTCQGLAEGGEYLFRIMAVNENGQSKPLTGTNPIIAKLPFDPPSAPGVPEVTEVGGDFVNLSWEKPDSDGGGRILGYWIDKREAGSTTWQQVNTNILCVPTQINISNLIEDRQYEFRVFAVNDAGTSPPSTASSSIKIKDPNAPTPPAFVQPLKIVYAVENKSAKFICTVTGNPRPTVMWSKGMRELSEGSKYTMLKEGDTYTLVISEVYGEDADEYSCRAVNKGGSRTSRAELIIKTVPRINVPPRFRDTACFEKGENITIKIPFTGNPRPKIKWSKEGEEIESGSHFEVITKERHAMLVIRDVTKTDSGPYRLVAENELGMDAAIIKVQINDKPDPPRFPIVENIMDESITLSWKPPQWDGGSHITNYLIEKREPPMTTWIRCGNTRCVEIFVSPCNRFTTHAIQGLNPSKEYEFRISAENIYGRSDPSDPTQPATTKPSRKEKAKKKHLMVDAQGRPIRGRAEGKITNYDQFVNDKFIPQPVDIKTSSVYDSYDILEEIGTGAFGVVHRCREKGTGRVFAAKFIPVSHPIEKTTIKKEIDIMNQLHHPKLINLHDAFEDDDEMILIYEFMSGGELFERITSEDYRMSEAEVIDYMRQICEGVKHMHEKNIIHLDIKPENVMCQSSKGNNVKLIDFGLATKLDPNEVVKISTGTAEFAAPEIVEREPVGFYTDMWAVGVLAYVLLSGLSPFAGESDIETLRNVKACDWDFDEDAFANVSVEGKDFIKNLLTKNKEKRLTAHECIEHNWLKGDHSELTSPIAKGRFLQFWNRIRQRYGESWDNCLLPLGHIANYSSLRKLHLDKYRIEDFYIDRRQAAPRFVIRPQSTFTYEGQSAKFFCRIVSASPAMVSWYRENGELKQSVKYMKRYQGNDFTLTINRCKLEDRGEYIVRAVNHFGSREEPVFLNVQSVPKEIPTIKLDDVVVRKRQKLDYGKVWEEPADSAPCFTFHLRPRFIQIGIGVKLLCCVSGKPTPEVKWYKDGHVIGKYDYTMSYSNGVITLDVPACSRQDAGKYQCIATNSHGEDETTCFVVVEARRGKGTSEGDSDLERKKQVKNILQSPVITPATPSSRMTAPSFPAKTTAKEPSPIPDKKKRTIKPYGKKDATSPARSRSATRELELPPDTDMKAPEFTTRLQHLSIKDGEAIVTKMYSQLSSSDIISLKYKSGVSSLSIGEVYPEDEGEYICKATNSQGTDSTACVLTVLPMEGQAQAATTDGAKPPRIIQHLKSNTVNDGEAYIMECKIKGLSKFDVVWLHDEKEIKPSKDFQYENDGDTYRLVIAEIFPEDSGSYTCEAFNDTGESFSSCTLVVVVPAEEMKGPVISRYPESVTVHEGQSASFTLETKKTAETSKYEFILLYIFFIYINFCIFLGFSCRGQ